MNPSAKRADQLQFLRFLAFCLIFIHHTDYSIGFPTPNGSGLAVSFFFILAGFVSAYSQYGKKDTLHWYSPFTYLGRKYLKVLPLHLLTLGISVLLSNVPAAFTAKDPIWLEPQLRYLAHNVLLIQSWFKDSYYHYNGVSWFLSTIMLSYLFTLPVSALLKAISRKKGATLSFMAIFVFLCAAIVLWCQYTADMEYTFFQYVFPPARLLEYLLGMVLCHLVLGLNEHLPNNASTTSLFTLLEIAALIFWGLFLFLPKQYDWSFLIVRQLAPNLILLGVFGFGSGYISRIFSWKPLKRLGDVSFECFLIHQLVIRIYLLFNAQIVTAGIREQGFKIISCFVISIGMALLLNKPAKPTRRKLT